MVAAQDQLTAAGKKHTELGSRRAPIAAVSSRQGLSHRCNHRRHTPTIGNTSTPLTVAARPKEAIILTPNETRANLT